MNDILAPFKPGFGNRHPVDKLGDIRALIKQAQAIEADLKDVILADLGPDDSIGGADFIAHQVIQERRGALDEKALKARFGDGVADCRKAPATFIKLEVRARVLDEADAA